MIPVLITARLSSTRLPKKHLLPLGSGMVISHVIERCEHFGFEPFLCVPEINCRFFADVCPTVKVLGGDDENVEARLIECATTLGIKHFHHLDGDDPFFDEFAVIDSFQAGVQFSRVYPSSNSATGSGRVGTTYNLSPRSMETRKLSDSGGGLHPWPQRLTLDYWEDYHLITAVNRIVGGYMAPRQAVDELFTRNPDLHLINWFRTAEWKMRQQHERRSQG